MAVTLKPVSRISGSLGQQGEEKVAALLEQELPDQFLILNSPRIAFHQNVVDIDHLVITNSCIYVIECKNMNGKITGGLMGNWIQERTSDGRKDFIKIGNPASQVNQYAKVVRDFVRSNYELIYQIPKNIKVEPIVVFSHENSNLSGMHFTSRGKIGKVHVLVLKDFIPLILSNTAENFTSEEMDQIADILVPPDQRDQTGVFPVLAELPVERFRGRFQLLEELGRGSQSTVYRAFDTKLDREVAVKKFNPVNRKEQMVERYRREAKITARLHHSNIVPSYDFYEDDGEYYLVMELVEGLNLSELLEDGPFSLAEVFEVYPFILDAVEYAHSQGVVHRDLKAANIILTEDRTVKITDFGVARLADDLELTQTRASIGTPTVMAPEQIMGKPGDYRVDIFALGVLLYQLLTGQMPFRGESLGELVQNVLNDQPIPPGSSTSGISRKLDQLVLKALEKDPENRFQTVTEMKEAFNEVSTNFQANKGDEGVLSRVFSGNQGWLRFWNNDRGKFYTVLLVTLAVFGWMVGLQFFMDSQVAGDTRKPLSGNENNILLPSNNPNVITNQNLQSVADRLLKLEGKDVKLTGRISNLVQQQGNSWVLQMLVRPEGAQQDLRLLVAYTGDPHTLFDERGNPADIQVIGTLSKYHAVDSRTNAMVDIPLVMAQRVEILEPWNVLAPANSRVQVGQTQTREGKTVTLDKLEFADTETRLFLTVKNTSAKNVFITLNNPEAVQKGSVVPQLYNLDNNYQMELKPGQQVNGLIILGPLNPLLHSAEFSLGNKVLGESPWVFKVEW